MTSATPTYNPNPVASYVLAANRPDLAQIKDFLTKRVNYFQRSIRDVTFHEVSDEKDIPVCPGRHVVLIGLGTSAELYSHPNLKGKIITLISHTATWEDSTLTEPTYLTTDEGSVVLVVASNTVSTLDLVKKSMGVVTADQFGKFGRTPSPMFSDVSE